MTTAPEPKGKPPKKTHDFIGTSAMFEPMSLRSDPDSNEEEGAEPVDIMYCITCNQYLGDFHRAHEGGLQDHIDYHDKKGNIGIPEVKRLIVGHPDKADHQEKLKHLGKHDKKDVDFLEKHMKVKISKSNKDKAL